MSNSKKQSGFFLTILHALQCMKRADDDVISNNRHHQRFRLGDASGGSESLLTFFSMIANVWTRHSPNRRQLITAWGRSERKNRRLLVLPIHTCHMYVHVRSTTANARYAINTNCSKKRHRVLVSRMCYALHIRAYGYYCLFFVSLFSLLHPPVTLFSFLSDRERSIDVSHVQELYESGEQVFFSSVRVQHLDFFLAFPLHNLGRRMLLVKCTIFIFRITCKVQYTFRVTDSGLRHVGPLRLRRFY